MTVETEAQMEAKLISQLQSQGWALVAIKDEDGLWANLRSQLARQNGTNFSDAEFAKIKLHLSKGSVFDRASTLRNRFLLARDDGSPFYIQFFNSDRWLANQFQVASQIELNGTRKNRYDVTLLVNGIPLCQIELKRRGVELKQAFNQVNRYHRDSFKAAGGLFMFVQIFVISNGVNTRYFANNKSQSFEQSFAWAGPDNRSINDLGQFASAFLTPDHLGKMIAKYVVLHQSNQLMMVLRSYQFFAAEAILRHVTEHLGNGYIWHSTGSGKTLTSFKAAQNLTALPLIDKVIFVVDRADLDYQTIQEFNHFEPKSVDATDDTAALVGQLTDSKTKLIVTTIQKLTNAVSRTRWAHRVDGLDSSRIVMIFDECHRTQFGDSHRKIVDFFPQAQLFGFTGTPIFAENAVGGRTTRDLFHDRLHTYVVTDAIRDGNVLRFAAEFHSLQAEDKLSDHEILNNSLRIPKIVDWMIQHHDRKTRQRQFGAIMAVASVDDLIAYYNAFSTARAEGRHDLKIAAIYTYEANEEDPGADGLIPDVEFPGRGAEARAMPKRDALVAMVADYNKLYGVNENVLSGEGFYAYYRALAERMKRRDKKSFVAEEGIDILLVVNMFLTGFDAKTVNTLYVDKNLRWHHLIQAFSRTNRTLSAEKAQGNIVCFRDLKERTDEAIAMFADKENVEFVLMGSYAEQLTKTLNAEKAVLEVVKTPSAVDDLPHEDAIAEFVRLFRALLRSRNSLASYAEFTPVDLNIPEQMFNDFKSKYLDLAQRQKADPDGDGEASALADIDFELELLHSVNINVRYILSLLAKYRKTAQYDGPESDIAQEQRRRILQILMSEPSLRSKRDHIEKFMAKHLMDLGPEDDVIVAFYQFMEVERSKAEAHLIEANKLNAQRFEFLVSEWLRMRRPPIQTAVLDVLESRPIVTKRKSVATRLAGEIAHFLEVFHDYTDGAEE